MMIKFENVVLPSAEQWRAIILGARNPMNSWERSDSYIGCDGGACDDCCNLNYGERCTEEYRNCIIGLNDLDLMKRLVAGGPVHAKYRRMITVYVDITAPLYWWKEFDTYKVGTVANSCSTMHKIADKEFTLEDFSCEHLMPVPIMVLERTIELLNFHRYVYVNYDKFKTEKIPTSNEVQLVLNQYNKKDIWWQMIQLLPSSYNQKRTVMLNYEVLAHIWNDRRNHKLDEWAEHPMVFHGNNGYDMDPETHRIKNIYKDYFGFCDWIKTLPYNELITGNFRED